ncbi:protein of unknown function [Methylocella tundrae]|uniref:Uncharacterized protein n=1 Tax=Methylocella tundrae TaxID=227605 RepID=A0A4U8Z5L8_METTU|nr:protein of unknown function [Methylocella tundrae]
MCALLDRLTIRPAVAFETELNCTAQGFISMARSGFTERNPSNSKQYELVRTQALR